MDNELFAKFVTNVEPGGCFEGHSYSWYHNGSGDYCTTIFRSYARPSAGYSPGCWSDPRRSRKGEVRLGRGTYRNIDGEWFIAKKRAELKAPYEA